MRGLVDLLSLRLSLGATMTAEFSGDRVSLTWPDACAELSARMAGREPFEDTLLRVAQLVKRFVGDVQDASVTILEQDSARTVVFTGALAIELDEAQYDVRFGPCLDAARSGRTIVAVTTSPGSAYPDFSQLALSREILQTVSIGLAARGTVSAGLNIYLTHDRPFSAHEMSRATTLANYARATVAQLATSASATETAELNHAIAIRALVDRATALLAGHNGCSRDQAMAELLGRSRSQHRPLADVAKSLASS
jgi:hypothetical protein